MTLPVADVRRVLRGGRCSRTLSMGTAADPPDRRARLDREKSWSRGPIEDDYDSEKREGCLKGPSEEREKGWLEGPSEEEPEN